MSGGIGLDNRFSFRMVRDLVDDHVLVSEREIREAMVFALVEHKLVVEGGGAVGIAAVLSGRLRGVGKRVAVVVSGGNVDAQVLMRVIPETHQ